MFIHLIPGCCLHVEDCSLSISLCFPGCERNAEERSTIRHSMLISRTTGRMNSPPFPEWEDSSFLHSVSNTEYSRNTANQRLSPHACDSLRDVLSSFRFVTLQPSQLSEPGKRGIIPIEVKQQSLCSSKHRRRMRKRLRVCEGAGT